ncbi:kinase-like protein, partial [Morchella conica CCBAS932]
EISILQTLTHPNIVRYISSDSEPPDGQARIFMEYCEGGDLSRFTDKRKRVDKALFTPEFIWRVFFQLALSLAYCHHGLNVTRLPNGVHKFEVEPRWTPILHRDIKPSNVLLWSSDSDIVKLCDFGIGKVIRSEMSGTYTGTSAFRPPVCFR